MEQGPIRKPNKSREKTKDTITRDPLINPRWVDALEKAGVFQDAELYQDLLEFLETHDGAIVDMRTVFKYINGRKAKLGKK